MAFSDIPVRQNGQRVTADWFNQLRSEGMNLSAAQISNVNAKTTTATLTDDEIGVIPLSTAGGAYTVTLPTAVGNTGLWYEFIKTTSDLNLATIDGDGAETINGASNYVLAFQHESVKIVSNGTNWDVVNTNKPRVLAFFDDCTSSVGSGASTLIDFPTEIIDTHGIVTNEGTGTSTSFPDTGKWKATAPKAGYFVVDYFIRWDVTASGWGVGLGCDMEVWKNGAVNVRQTFDNMLAAGGSSTDVCMNFVPAPVSVAATDYVQIVVLQVSTFTYSLSAGKVYIEFVY
jgi:hypothetical protein